MLVDISYIWNIFILVKDQSDQWFSRHLFPSWFCIIWDIGKSQLHFLTLQRLNSFYLYALFYIIFNNTLLFIRILFTFYVICVIPQIFCSALHCPKSNPNFRNITLNVVLNMILHELFRVVSRFPRYISCYIAENGFPLGQCMFIYSFFLFSLLF